MLIAVLFITAKKKKKVETNPINDEWINKMYGIATQ